MIIRVISDVHANLQALEAVVAHWQGRPADLTVCLGDVTGYGADPAACLEIVRSEADLVLMGNHDSGICGMSPLDWFNNLGVAAIEWQRPILEKTGGDAIPWLSGLPLEARVEDLFLCHAYPPDPGSWRYVLHAHDAIRTARALPGTICLVGHTHLPCVWSASGDVDVSPSGRLDESTCIVNCGSVGQPRDGDPRAAYLILDTQAMTFRHVRVSYDVEEAAARIRAAGLPERLASRLSRGM